MGNECSKSCVKKKKISRHNTTEMPVVSCRASGTSNRETVNDFSVLNFKQVKILANSSNVKGLKEYFSQGFLVDFPLDQSGWTLLHLACQKGDTKLVEFLIEYKPYLDAQELAEGWSPLMVAVINDFDEIVRILINAGASLELVDKLGKNYKQLAEKYKSAKVLKVI